MPGLAAFLMRLEQGKGPFKTLLKLFRRIILFLRILQTSLLTIYFAVCEI